MVFVKLINEKKEKGKEYFMGLNGKAWLGAIITGLLTADGYTAAALSILSIFGIVNLDPPDLKDSIGNLSLDQ